MPRAAQDDPLQPHRAHAAQELGQFLAAIRTRAGLTLADLAQRLGYGVSYVSLIEHGQRVPPWHMLLAWLRQSPGEPPLHYGVALWLRTHQGPGIPWVVQAEPRDARLLQLAGVFLQGNAPSSK
ncbi:MAG: helix-turn-helix transcriptional regulator [Deltaproteobacteria bacterium]|nr:helix-turn-helix transcriptional regulator [Deltaproteobacteria bacterium]